MSGTKHPWPSARILVLGTMPDEDAASVLGYATITVRSKRQALGIPRFERFYEKPEADGHQRPCTVCGRWFRVAPSDKVATCGLRCLKVRAREARNGIPWSESARARLRASLTVSRLGNLRRGTPAAQDAALANPERHHEAKDWSVIDPAGVPHEVRNLRRWLFNRLGQTEGGKVYDGLKAVRAWQRGKTKRTVTTSHGWRLADQ